MITITLQGLDDVQEKFAALQETVRAALLEKSQTLAQALADKVSENLSGSVLQSKTGRLKNSINSSVDAGSELVTGSVFVDGDVPYAAIQEYGGSTKAHIIEVTNAKVLAFNWGGKMSFFTHVNHPGSVIPERSYMRSSLADMTDDIVTGMSDAVGDAING